MSLYSKQNILEVSHHKPSTAKSSLRLVFRSLLPGKAQESVNRECIYTLDLGIDFGS